MWQQCAIKVEETRLDEIHFNINARINDEGYNDLVQEPFILKQDFEYVLFMDYYQCTCLNLPKSPKIDSVVRVEIV